MDPLVAHQRAQDAFAGVLANVSADQYRAPTPCSEWTVRDLIEHVISGNEHVGQWAQHPVEPPARPDDILAAHRTAAAAAQEIFAAPSGMSTTFKLPFGEIPGQVFIGMRTSDVLTHAWDLASATGQSTELDPELATEQLGAVRGFVGPQFRGPGKPFAEEQPCSSERAPADQLAAFLGRNVR
ncbi:TIGR03086 family metal-binding protein [Mycobacterium ostraviense]|uniref:TIGR03086 family protein n=1 Tax=Mycobacterium ostraviense TaxID=2738409 RepID=A0A164A197_9MYCO|nr:TIGR03086 family metal-binding protein [Mycobacterium ostraviense]KZS62002.1 TIGR03086 family protein [Mycobacterium ostraviense]UGT90605.1 TIGR03086 family metal-binding protein [Mycobacterium ostraviense]